MTGHAAPFPPDPGRAARNGDLLARSGAAFEDALTAAMAGPQRDPRHPAATVLPDAVAQLVEAFGDG